MPDLPPCPFCGSAPTREENLVTGFYLGCGNRACKVRPGVLAQSRRIAIRWWTTRWNAAPRRTTPSGASDPRRERREG